MPKVSFRMASACRESVFGVQTNTARKIHRSDHTEDRLTAPSGCCVRKGTLSDTPGGKPSRLTTLLRLPDRESPAGLGVALADPPADTTVILMGKPMAVIAH
jgi:hypothetical protein